MKGFIYLIARLIKVREFMNAPDERHAFVIGFCEVLCPLPPRWHCEEPAGPREAVSREYHYYSSGRALALLAWLGIVKLIQVVF